MSEQKKKIPMRMCVGCRQMHEKRELVRIVAGQDGMAHVDLTGRAQGRGAYLCRNAECFDKAVKTRAIERALAVKLDEGDRAILAEGK